MPALIGTQKPQYRPVSSPPQLTGTPGPAVCDDNWLHVKARHVSVVGETGSGRSSFVIMLTSPSPNFARPPVCLLTSPCRTALTAHDTPFLAVIVAQLGLK